MHSGMVTKIVVFAMGAAALGYGMGRADRAAETEAASDPLPEVTLPARPETAFRRVAIRDWQR